MRASPGNLTTIFSNSSAAYNILYRTTDTHSQPAWAVTTFFIPKDTDGSALLSYQIPYDAVNVDASPSYSLYAPVTSLSSIWYSDIQKSLSFGWYVHVPDFEGPLASYTEGFQSGHAVLDSVRAVLNLGTRHGLRHDAKYAMWGYSGGSIGSEWAAELQAQYAPELNFAGAALGGLIPNVPNALSAVTETKWASVIPEALIGMTSQYPEAREYLLSQLKPDGSGPFNKTTFLSVTELFAEQIFAAFANQNIYNHFKNGKSFFEAPVIQAMFTREGYMGFHGVPTMPLFVYKAIEDELTPVKDTDDLAQRYCSLGVNILYERNTVGGHIAEEINGDTRAFQWLSKVLEGVYDHEGCTVSNVTYVMTS